MIFNKNSFYALALTGSVILGGCSLKQMIKLAKDQKLTVNPSPLELHGDSVKGEISALLPVKMLKKNKIYGVKSKYVSGDNTVDLGEIEFKQNPDFPKAKVEQPKLSKPFSFAYNDKLNRGELKVVGTAYNTTKSKSKSTDELPIAKGIITTSRLVQNNSFALLADHGYNNKEELEPTNIAFSFEKGKSKLTKNEAKSETAKYFDAFIAKKNVTRVVTITGSHSPEGTETINSKLSEERASLIEKFYKENMAKHKYNKGTMDSIQFVLKAQVKDWVAFKDLVNNDSVLDATKKAEILAIINAPAGDYEQKEKLLQTLPSYKHLVKSVYPNLRTAKTEILTVKHKKSDAQISTLAKQVAEGKLKKDTLSAEELLYSATLTPLSEEKEAIYKAASVDADKMVAYNNLGALYIESGNKAYKATDKVSFADKAITQLTLANQKQENALSYANLASAYMLKSDYINAAIAANKANELAKDADTKKIANSILGVCKIKSGAYDEAVSLLQNGVSDNATVKYNLALAYLLKKDFEKAKVSFDEATTADDKNALAFYGSAITAARMNNIDVLAGRLRSAIKIDEKLRAKALEDLEFANFWNNSNFKDALK
jgi:tetratricopeptide (TPR) repeat protein/outer membrane protein OmpA-like peptidoglycan-associated protein